MKKPMLLFFVFCFCSMAFADSGDLIDFDKRRNRSYLKENTVLSARLNEGFNFFREDSAESVFSLDDVFSNFAKDRVSGIFLRIEYEDWTYRWLKANRNLRVYFLVDTNGGLPKLIGYSKKKIEIKRLKAYKKEKAVVLRDFTNVPIAEEGVYVVGWVESGFSSSIYNLVFKQSLMLIYPSDLKTREVSLYGEAYPLIKPISVAMAQHIVNGRIVYLVLKEEGGQYEICGYVK